jgi:hypothetical protein
MKTLPQDITERFYKTIKGDIHIDDFEQWLYADKELEKVLNSNDYLDLISLSYKKSGAKYELWNLLNKHIDLGEFETYKILELLKEAQLKTDRLPYILMEFYDLYCKGYNFLQDLGLGIGLAVVVPRVSNTSADIWDELTLGQQNELLDSFYPELEECIKDVIDFLEAKKIILTGEQDFMGHYGYEDLRTEVERKSKLWTLVSEDETTAFSSYENKLLTKKINKNGGSFETEK